MGQKQKLSNFETRLHNAEQRTKRKLRRLEKKGVRITGINPLQNFAEMTTGQKRSYETRLEKFIARQNRIIAGYEGVPIHYAVVKQVRAAEKKLNEQRSKQWAGISGKTTLTKGSPMTTDGFRDMGRTYSPVTGLFTPNAKSPLFGTELKHRDVSLLKSENDAKAYIKRLKHLGTKSYIDHKNQIMIENMLKVMQDINDPQLAARISKLTAEQIYILSASDFIQSVFMNSGNDGVGVVASIIDHLNDQLDALESKEI